MTFPVTDPIFQTQIFAGLFLLALAMSCRKRAEAPSLSPTASTEIKGFAILGVILAHIGYYLAQDTRFLFPLSIIAGVGVNLFLFLSGYGLTWSTLNKLNSTLSFYQRRVSRVIIPLWIVLTILFVVNRFVLHATPSLTTILQSFFGFFPNADLYQSLDAPLWYLTLLLFYYLIFPLVFFRKQPWISAIVLAGIGLVFISLPLPVSEGVLQLYRSHLLAFPIGVFVASVFVHRNTWPSVTATKISAFLQEQTILSAGLRWAILTSCVVLFACTSLHSGVGQGPVIEQSISLFTMLCTIAVFLLKPFENRFFYLVGVYSYEIYLLHWPLVYRYDILYRFLPPGIATFVYLFVFLGIGWLFQRLAQFLIKKARIA